MSHTITRGARRSEDVLEVTSVSGARNEVKFDHDSKVVIERKYNTTFVFPLEEAVAMARYILDRVEEVPTPKYRLVED